MNAPQNHRELKAGMGRLRVFAFFHLNLAFSSIEEERRGEVIAKCYWPLLRLAEARGPIGIEASGFTLEEIAARDPAWIEEAKKLIARGHVELIGSGYSQLIGPLVPARIVAQNLEIGNAVYEKLLGARPSIALVNEQAYSAGLVGHYLDASYEAILMDWDNPASHHPEWDAELQYLPQHAVGADGRKIALLWTNTTAFQQLQRYAYADTSLPERRGASSPLETYLRFVRARRSLDTRALCLYASDAEIFDFRPGRFRTEEALPAGSEWKRLDNALTAVAAESGINLIAPSHVLKLIDREGAGRPLALQSAACPVPVKKQRKYSLSRWAVTGRDNTAVNAACERILRGMNAAKPEPADWKELCYLWSSDFRTHLTEKRWKAFCTRLKAAERKWSPAVSLPAPLATPLPWGEPESQRHLSINTPQVAARLDRRRGLAIERIRFGDKEQAAIGGLSHGFFDDITLQADWYTGDCVFEAPGEHKITDLEWCEAQTARAPNGDMFVHGRIETPKGPIEKIMRFHAAEPRVDFDLAFHWDDWGKGSLRLGHITLLPDAFNWSDLALITHNGGVQPERFALAGSNVDHGAPVSFLVSSSHGFGMTEGWAEITDGKTGLRVEVDRATAPLLGMLTHRAAGRSLFCQIQLSALELDDTRKPGVYQKGPRRFRFSIRGI